MNKQESHPNLSAHHNKRYKIRLWFQTPNPGNINYTHCKHQHTHKIHIFIVRLDLDSIDLVIFYVPPWLVEWEIAEGEGWEDQIPTEVQSIDTVAAKGVALLDE